MQSHTGVLPMEEYYAQNMKTVVNLCDKFMKPSDDKENAIHDILFTSYMKYKHNPELIQTTTLAYVVAETKEYLKTFKRQKREYEASYRKATTQELLNAISRRRNNHYVIVHGLSLLDPGDRYILIRYYIDEATFAEIAKEINKSDNYVRERAAAGIVQLRELLTEM